VLDPIIPPPQGDVYQKKGSLPAALQLWQEYQEQHSHESLVQHPHNRQFQVVYYSCPHAAGNILHDFFHQVLVAVALNRTMLVKYSDKKTCERVNEGYSPILCLTDNAEPDCNRILQRAAWVPSYDAWVDRLELEQLPPQRHSKFRRPLPAQTYNNATFNNILLWLNERVITMTPRVYQTPERFLLVHNPFLQSPLSASRITRLYSESTDYLYGMLFRGIFSFHPEILPSDYDEERQQSADSDETTFALHSRHRSPQDDGSNVTEYMNCLDRVFQESRALQDQKQQRQHPQSHSTCRVFLMADRNITLYELDHVIRTKHCTPVVATHQRSAGHFKEHGPFAGAGFFQDLALASQARNGLIGHCDRSSTQLLRELIHYDRTMEALAAGTYQELPELVTCCLR
jgi:hypothetical protein